MNCRPEIVRRLGCLCMIVSKSIHRFALFVYCRTIAPWTASGAGPRGIIVPWGPCCRCPPGWPCGPWPALSPGRLLRAPLNEFEGPVPPPPCTLIWNTKLYNKQKETQTAIPENHQAHTRRRTGVMYRGPQELQQRKNTLVILYKMMTIITYIFRLLTIYSFSSPVGQTLFKEKKKQVALRYLFSATKRFCW